MKKLIGVAFYLTCSFLTWGMVIGSMTCTFPDQNPYGVAASLAALGPGGIVGALVFEGGDNIGNDHAGFQFRLKPLTREQRWQAFHERYPELSRYYFDHGYEENDPRCKAADVTGCK